MSHRDPDHWYTMNAGLEWPRLLTWRGAEVEVSCVFLDEGSPVELTITHEEGHNLRFTDAAVLLGEWFAGVCGDRDRVITWSHKFNTVGHWFDAFRSAVGLS